MSTRFSPQFRHDDWPWKCAPGDQRLPKGNAIQLYEREVRPTSLLPFTQHTFICYLPTGDKWVSSARNRDQLLKSVTERATGMGLVVSSEIIRI